MLCCLSRRAKPKAVNAHFINKHILPFGFAEQYGTQYYKSSDKSLAAFYVVQPLDFFLFIPSVVHVTTMRRK